MDISQAEDRPASDPGMEVPFADQSVECIDYGFYCTYGLAFLIVNNYKYIFLNEKYNRISKGNSSRDLVTAERNESDINILFQPRKNCYAEISRKPEKPCNA